jgi:Beta-propeller repeat
MFIPVGRVIAAVFIGAFVLTQAAVTSAWTPTTDRINVATFGGTVKSIAVDVAGNIYTTGFFSGTADLDPGAANVNLTSAGGTDAFVSKLNSQGELEWAYRLGGTGADAGLSITVDTASNVYIGGYFSATVDFDPSAAIVNLVSAGSDEAFIWKLNSLGELVWARQVAGVGMSAVNAVAVDSAGFVLATGGFAGIADFDPSASSENLRSEGSVDVFAWKLNSLGEFVWAKYGGSSGFDTGQSIAVDSMGSLYITGSFGGTADFDPSGNGANLSSTGFDDVFVWKLSTAGAVEVIVGAGGPGFDSGNSIAVDPSGFLYVTGFFEGTADFDPNGSAANLISAGSGDVFVWKLTSAGLVLGWAKHAGGSGFDSGASAVVDSGGNVHVTGSFMNTADFDPSVNRADRISLGSDDVFVWKLNSLGELVWVKQTGGVGQGSDFGGSLDLDSSGNVYVAGGFVGTADFDPNENVSNLTSAGSEDAFVWKLTSGGAVAVSPAPAPEVPAAVTPNPTTVAASLVSAPASVSYRAANKGVTLRWGAVVGASSYVVTTTSGAQVCAATTTNCVVNRLRNGRAYSYNVFAVNADGVRSATSTRVSARPGFQVKRTTVKTKRSVSLSSIVTTPSKGKKTWTVTSGACRINGARLVTPTKRGSCKLRLSTTRSGSYAAMSTTINVSVR